MVFALDWQSVNAADVTAFVVDRTPSQSRGAAKPFPHEPAISPAKGAIGSCIVIDDRVNVGTFKSKRFVEAVSKHVRPVMAVWDVLKCHGRTSRLPEGAERLLQHRVPKCGCFLPGLEVPTDA